MAGESDGPGLTEPAATDSAADSGSGAPVDGAEEEVEPALSGAPRAARGVAQEILRPRSETWARPRGTLHLYSGAEGFASARAALTPASGWTIENIQGKPTSQWTAAFKEQAAEQAARAKAGAAPGEHLPTPVYKRIWGPRSWSVVFRGACAGHPVQCHGNAGPGTIQGDFEVPARRWGGGLGGALMLGTGLFTAIVGAQDPNPAVGISLGVLGVGEATSGMLFTSAAVLGATEAMRFGTLGGTAFGGVAGLVAFGAAVARSWQAGDAPGVFFNALGVAGSGLLIASMFTPVGPLLGIVLTGLAVGFNLNRWWSSR